MGRERARPLQINRLLRQNKGSCARPPWYKAGPPEGDPAKSSFNYHPGLRPL